MTTNQILSIIYPILLSLLTALLAWTGKCIVKVTPRLVDLVVLKIGKANYEKLLATGWECWHIVEENGRIAALIESKVKDFESLMKRKNPGITDEQINDIRQAIAGEFNKDKPAIVKTVEAPTQVVTVQPMMIYKTPDGVELQPVQPTE